MTVTGARPKHVHADDHAPEEAHDCGKIAKAVNMRADLHQIVHERAYGR